MYPLPDDIDAWGQGGAFWVRGDSNLPILSSLGIAPALFEPPFSDEGPLESTILHELGHCLGFADWMWNRLDLLHLASQDSLTNDTYFSGAQAQAAFNRAGGWTYTGHKVPVENQGDDNHWRETIFGAELMSPEGWYREREPLSAITIQSLADIGYQVDVRRAEAYTLPPPWAATGLAAQGGGSGARSSRRRWGTHPRNSLVIDEDGRVEPGLAQGERGVVPTPCRARPPRPQRVASTGRPLGHLLGPPKWAGP